VAWCGTLSVTGPCSLPPGPRDQSAGDLRAQTRIGLLSIRLLASGLGNIIASAALR